MTRLFNDPKNKTKRKHLRNHSTNAENILWSKLQKKQFHNLKFRRQQGIGPFIVDFYCPAEKVVIEIDGWTHLKKEEVEYDKNRESKIKKLGIKVIRFTNEDIYENLDTVMEQLEKVICKKFSSPPATSANTKS